MSSSSDEPRQYSLVVFKDWYKKELKKFNMQSWIDHEPFIYFGEIPNMPGHAVLVSHKTGKVFSGLHIEDFRELTEEET